MPDHPGAGAPSVVLMILACFGLFAMQGWARWEAT